MSGETKKETKMMEREREPREVARKTWVEAWEVGSAAASALCGRAVSRPKSPTSYFAKQPR